MIAAGKACGEALRAAGVVGKSSMERDQMISNATKRSILRRIHIIFSIPILGYIYEQH